MPLSKEDLEKVQFMIRNQDHDSFAVFRSGLKDNWIFLTALVATGLWIFNQFGVLDAVNSRQDFELETAKQERIDLDSNQEMIVERLEKADDFQTELTNSILLIERDIGDIKNKLDIQQ